MEVLGACPTVAQPDVSRTNRYVSSGMRTSGDEDDEPGRGREEGGKTCFRTVDPPSKACLEAKRRTRGLSFPVSGEGHLDPADP